MKVAFVAGPYRANTIFGIKRNIDRAEAISLELWKKGYAVVCPHKNTSFFDGELDDEVWLKGGRELLSRCDIVVVCPVWEQSEGTQLEIAYANDIGKEVYFSIVDVPSVE